MSVFLSSRCLLYSFLLLYSFPSYFVELFPLCLVCYLTASTFAFYFIQHLILLFSFFLPSTCALCFLISTCLCFCIDFCFYFCFCSCWCRSRTRFATILQATTCDFLMSSRGLLTLHSFKFKVAYTFLSPLAYPSSEGIALLLVLGIVLSFSRDGYVVVLECCISSSILLLLYIINLIKVTPFEMYEYLCSISYTV